MTVSVSRSLLFAGLLVSCVPANSEPLPIVAGQSAIVDEWQARQPALALGEAGRVVMTYGDAPPALVCAPLHICAIEFGPEEEFHDAPSLSDPVRWQMEVREGFAAGSRRQYIIVKPAQNAGRAILTVFTNRRFYSLALIPDPKTYTPILAFRYPDDEAAVARARIEAQARETAEAAANEAAAKREELDHTGLAVHDGLVAAGDLNFAYRIAGKAAFAPQRIYDDGRKTYIELPQSWRGEFPIFLASDAGGTDRVVNYRVDGRRYEIEGVYETSTLRLGRDLIRIRRD